MYADTLLLIVQGARRRPSPRLAPRLHECFRQLAEDPLPSSATRIADRIWDLWMRYPDRAATADLERATRALGALDFDAAESMLESLVWRHPDFAEAWNKRATLCYMQQRDEECMVHIARTLALEPRHFGAACGFAEICLSHGMRDYALFAFEAALRLHPHMTEVRERVAALLSERTGPLH